MFRPALIVSLLTVVGCSSSASDDGASEAGASGAEQGGTGAAGGNQATGGSNSAGAGGTIAGTGGAPAAGGSAESGGSTNLGGSPASAGHGSSSGGSGQAGEDDTGGGAGAPSGSAGAAVASHTNPLSKPLIEAFVAAHNAARSRTDLNPIPAPPLPPVSWDPILADSAYNYLSRCVATDGQLVDHNMDRSTDYQALGGKDAYVGENIYATTGTTVTPGDALNSWMSESSKYDYAKNDLSSAGHYTQVVWRDSIRIGCAIVNCPNARFNNTVLCDYAPGGNISGQKPY